MAKKKIHAPTVADLTSRGATQEQAEQAIALLKASDAATLALEIARLREQIALYREMRRPQGPAPTPPRTADGRLIAEVVAATGLSIAVIAHTIGVKRQALVRANDPEIAWALPSNIGRPRKGGAQAPLSLLADAPKRRLMQLRDAFDATDVARLKASDPVGIALHVVLLREQVALYRVRVAGRPRGRIKARTPDGAIIAAAVDATHLSRADLARAIGGDKSLLTRANNPNGAPLGDDKRKRLQRIVDVFAPPNGGS